LAAREVGVGIGIGIGIERTCTGFGHERLDAYHAAISAKLIEVGVGIGIGIGIERTCMGFGHERLDVYHSAVDYVGWAYRYPGTIPIPMSTPIPIPTGNER